jgi:hypothetical protein
MLYGKTRAFTWRETEANNGKYMLPRHITESGWNVASCECNNHTVGMYSCNRHSFQRILSNGPRDSSFHHRENFLSQLKVTKIKHWHFCPTRSTGNKRDSSACTWQLQSLNTIVEGRTYVLVPIQPFQLHISYYLQQRFECRQVHLPETKRKGTYKTSVS